jgi:hypothetical protein
MNSGQEKAMPDGPKQLVTPLILNDEPLDLEPGDTAYFQFAAYANTLARLIPLRKTRTPLTVGIFGE